MTNQPLAMQAYNIGDFSSGGSTYGISLRKGHHSMRKRSFATGSSQQQQITQSRRGHQRGKSTNLRSGGKHGDVAYDMTKPARNSNHDAHEIMQQHDNIFTGMQNLPNVSHAGSPEFENVEQH